MEGYIHVYHKKQYAKYWCILDGQQLSYYERLDLPLQLAVGIVVSLGSCIVLYIIV
jgi:hypothetical protein